MSDSHRKRSIKLALAWAVTFVALYLAFRSVDFNDLLKSLAGAQLWPLLVAFIFTALSYLLRARRWQLLFVEGALSYANALRVLLLGFFMNNILPARAGELVRAHMGAKFTGTTRTLVLATIVMERLVDGLTISLMFVVFALGIGRGDMSQNLLSVAYLFLFVGVVVFILFFKRRGLFAFLDSMAQIYARSRFSDNKLGNKAVPYLLHRTQQFVDGLAPLFTFRLGPLISVWSIVVWSVELAVYLHIARAYNADLSVAQCVLFLVAVNFSSLIPAAPGGIGVIEAVASAALVSIGMDREHALAMVITQHAMQYLVVGIPGALILLSSRSTVKSVEQEISNDTEDTSVKNSTAQSSVEGRLA